MTKITLKVSNIHGFYKNINLNSSILLKENSYFSGILSFVGDKEEYIHEIEDEHIIIEIIVKYLKYGILEHIKDLNTAKLLLKRVQYYCLEGLEKLLIPEISRLNNIMYQLIPFNIDPIDIDNYDNRHKLYIYTFKLWDGYFKKYSIEMELIEESENGKYSLLLKCIGRWGA